MNDDKLVTTDMTPPDAEEWYKDLFAGKPVSITGRTGMEVSHCPSCKAEIFHVGWSAEKAILIQEIKRLREEVRRRWVCPICGGNPDTPKTFGCEGCEAELCRRAKEGKGMDPKTYGGELRPLTHKPEVDHDFD